MSREVMEMSDADAEEARGEAFAAYHENCETCGETVCLQSPSCDCGWDAGARREDDLTDHADRGLCRDRGAAKVRARALIGAKILLGGDR